ncbi:FKBP-type peptidyl-prolyl cis-trans isomerase [Myxococcus sp. Y35]|uniref:FKBP-type peptidyl-prolyl cis-trans isomerase n=1 Tax=Pseudomyxococcus flavus TaxID=3115648 RepID=UPI003CF4833E
MWMAALVFALGATAAQAQDSKSAKKPAGKAAPATEPAATPLSPEEEQTIYTLGLTIGRDLSLFALSPEEMAVLQRGLTDGLGGKTSDLDPKEQAQRIQAFAKARQARAGQAVLDRAAKEPGAEVLPSGVVYKQVKAGSGKSPRAIDTVKVHYEGRLVDGTVFDASARRGIPVEFPLNGVIPCWTQGVSKMKVGGKAKLTCPANTAYGERPPTGSRIPPNAVLVFDVELIDIPGDTSRQP